METPSNLGSAPMKRLNWKNAIYYGEVFGFVFAWAVGLVIALSSSRDGSAAQDTNTVVAAGATPRAID
ncbi:hypothetical protein Pla123a_25490 [Posidoniimonas polymericola]|uniref:Uncharacterized protein n=2 Tax=Posidoniimonas polymericola TaxID=2528002 RepID=A0A5C5YQN7_9BACT|nr:hypothetical protein Pla123a_25490 [Posidoniimonas polymericola]